MEVGDGLGGTATAADELGGAAAIELGGAKAPELGAGGVCEVTLAEHPAPASKLRTAAAVRASPCTVTPSHLCWGD
jgi:hypothetical protein